MAHSKEQNKPPETTPEELLASVLLGKYFKIAILNILKELKENTDKGVRKNQENDL